MIVHGDPGREEPLHEMLSGLRSGIDRMLAPSANGNVNRDTLRRLLIQAGELEQALFDAPSSAGALEDGGRTLRSLRAATTHAARALLAACDARTRKDTGRKRVRGALERMRRALERFPESRGDSGRVWVKVPDGFAFHALLPEQYRVAAIRWSEEHPEARDEEILVVGVRSIGTTLSAVVLAALKSRGFRARRVTVRPKGDPSERRLQLGTLRPAAWGLIVDEGPGLSGSSVLAAADALARAGIERIHVFPEARRRGGTTLARTLWNAVDPEGLDPLARATECGGGDWRSLQCGPREEWPAVCRTLERPKILCEGSSGRRVLFKFAGFATAPGTSRSLAEVHAERLGRLARRGLTPPPVAAAHGYVGVDWLEGRPLTAADATPELAARMGSYVAAASGPPLSVSAARAARNRLETMLSANTAEALGSESASVALAFFRPLAALEHMPRCGDGHMAPHEWIDSRERGIQKTDAGGHELDPVWTGRQPVIWDLAGAIEEWDLSPELTQALLEGYASGGGYSCASFALDAYAAAYAAHRAGQIRLALDAEGDPEERARLTAEYERWRVKLGRRLGFVPTEREDRSES